MTNALTVTISDFFSHNIYKNSKVSWGERPRPRPPPPQFAYAYPFALAPPPSPTQKSAP